MALPNFKKRYQNLSKLVGKNNTKKLYFLFIILIISSLIEMLSISSIPFLALAIVDKEQFLSFLPEGINIDFFFDLEKSYLISYLCIATGLIFLIKNLFLALFIYFQSNVIKTIKIEISKTLLKKYLSQNYLFFIDKGSSIITRSILIDVGNTTIFTLNHINLIKEVLVLIAIFCLLIIFNPFITFSIFILLTLVISIYILFTKNAIYERGKEINFLSERVINTVNQITGSIKDIKLFKSEFFFLKYFDKIVTSTETKVAKNNFISSLPRNLLELFIVFTILSVFSVFVFLDKTLGELIPYISLFVVSSLRLMPGFNAISNSLLTIKKLTPNFDFVLNEFQRLNDTITNKVTNKSDRKFNFRKNIIIENVNFKYQNSKTFIFKDLNLVIKNGEKLGIIGESGSGKTTLVNLIVGLLEPTDGKIIIDDLSFKEISEDWKSLIGYVHQDTFILNDTIINNIAFGKSDEIDSKNKVNSALKKAQLEKFVNSLEKGYEAEIKDNGKNLSGGQRQRLGIARALYNDPDLIILDEATNSLDIDTENKFIDEVFKNSNDKTIIFISHKMSALSKCDKIFDLKQKRFIK